MSQLKLDETFKRSYQCQCLDELPSLAKRHFYYPGGITTGGKDGVVVKVIPADTEPWIGTFAFGILSPKGITGLFTYPDQESLCVVSLGKGYIVNTEEPKTFQLIKMEPVLLVIPILSRNIIVFGDYNYLVAYNNSGQVWQTQRLSWDGIKIGKVTEENITGQVWDLASESYISFIVDLKTGHHVGGSSGF